MPHGNTTLAACACAWLALWLGGCANSNDSQNQRSTSGGGPKHDQAALQGSWEQLPEEPGPGTPRQRVFKVVSGDKEVVTTYDAQDRAIHSQTARFRLSRANGVPLYTYYGATVTANAGEEKAEGPRSYLYKLHGNDLYEVWGLLPGQEERAVLVKRWKRVGPAPGK
jgi:hypothetical protein